MYYLIHYLTLISVFGSRIKQDFPAVFNMASHAEESVYLTLYLVSFHEVSSRQIWASGVSQSKINKAPNGNTAKWRVKEKIKFKVAVILCISKLFRCWFTVWFASELLMVLLTMKLLMSYERVCNLAQM